MRNKKELDMNILMIHERNNKDLDTNILMIYERNKVKVNKSFKKRVQYKICFD